MDQWWRTRDTAGYFLLRVLWLWTLYGISVDVRRTRTSPWRHGDVRVRLTSHMANPLIPSQGSFPSCSAHENGSGLDFLWWLATGQLILVYTPVQKPVPVQSVYTGNRTDALFQNLIRNTARGTKPPLRGAFHSLSFSSSSSATTLQTKQSPTS